MPSIRDLYPPAQSIVDAVRRPTPAAAPAWVRDMPRRIGELLRDRHLQDGPCWGLAVRNPTFPTWCEHGSANLLHYAMDFDLFDSIGGWSDAARQGVIAHWQSWQDPATGRFVDPRDPTRTVNEKYVTIILDLLGAKPLYPHSVTSAGGTVDAAAFVDECRNHPDWQTGAWSIGSRAGYMARELLDLINDQDRRDLIPAFEQGVAAMLSHQCPDDGLWGPATAHLARRIGGNLKVVGRLYFMLGIRVPHARPMADALIRHQANGDWYACSKNICITRNVVEMAAFCLEVEPDYRRDEVLGVMDAIVADWDRGWLNPDGSTSDDRGEAGGISNGLVYAPGLVGGYLHWADCPLPNPLVHWPATRGLNLRLLPVYDEATRRVHIVEAAHPIAVRG